MARTAGAAGAADPVDVILGMDRHVEVEDVTETADVDPASSHVAADQQADIAGLEAFQRGEAHGLRKVAVEGAGRETMLDERFGKDVDVALAVAEDKCVLHVLSVEQRAKRTAFFALLDQCQAGFDGGGDGRRA